jgi:uncharacterized protein YehS (DUF1456 family)
MNYKKLVEQVGKEGQIKKSMEELIELLELLIKTQTKEVYFPQKILENLVMKEIAHVYMVLRSLRIVFNIKDEDIIKEIKHKENKLINKYPEIKR